MTRRKRGTGSITPAGEGAWLVRWPEGGARPGKIVKGSRDYATRVLSAILAELEQRGDMSTPTLKSYGERYLDREELRGRRGVRAQRSRWRCHVLTAPFVDDPLPATRPGDIRRWLDDLEERGLSARTVRHCAYLLSAIYRDALEREHVKVNPVAAVRKPSALDTRREQILSIEQIAKLLEDDCGDDAMRSVALVFVGTCLRPGELLGLRLDEVRGDHLSVQRSDRATTTTKTKRPRRVELCGVGAFGVLRWLSVIRPALRIRGCLPQSSPWAFPIPRGWLRTDHRLGRVLEAIGAGDLTAHDLRGTGATHYLSGSFGRPWTIAEVAAHIGDSIQTTERHYAHLAPAAARRAAEGIGTGSLALAKTSVGHEGLEPSANGLRDFRGSESARKVAPISSLSDPVLAERALRAIADGAHDAHAVAAELARGAAALGQDAALVLSGAPGWARAANRIARHVLGLEIAMGDAVGGAGG